MPVTTSDNHDGQSEGLVTLGAKLRSLREAQDLSYENITEAIHVRPFVLQAIEDGRILDVTDSVYARGFVKNYCEYLYADDLWKKYKDFFTSPPDDITVKVSGFPSSVGINHPTPIFRRSSLLWVYLILILAVLAAGYLLWFQQKESRIAGFAGFFLRDNITGEREAGGDGQPGGGVVSRDALPTEANRPPAPTASSDRTVPGGQAIPGNAALPANASVDLSWMDGNPPAGATRSAEPAAVNNKLSFEVIGARCRLEVLQNGLMLTARTLTRTQTRAYDVTTDTEVRISDGSAIKVVWRGNTYQGVGERNSPVSFRFSPSGEMKLIKGKSQYGQ